MRRRQRLLRSWAKRERMTVTMVLAERLHHGRQKVGGGEHEGPRALKTARATGAWRGVLKEVVASLAGGDDVDTITVSFLDSEGRGGGEKGEGGEGAEGEGGGRQAEEAGGAHEAAEAPGPETGVLRGSSTSCRSPGSLS